MQIYMNLYVLLIEVRALDSCHQGTVHLRKVLTQRCCLNLSSALDLAVVAGSEFFRQLLVFFMGMGYFGGDGLALAVPGG